MSDKSSRLQLERRRAENAFQSAMEAKTKVYAEEYKSLVRKTPMRIKTCGLCATISFMFSKGKKENAHSLLYTQLGKWLTQSQFLTAQSGEMVHDLILLENAEYRAASNESLAFFAWLRRFSDGLIEK